MGNPMPFLVMPTAETRHLSALGWALLAYVNVYFAGKLYGPKHPFCSWEKQALDYPPLEGWANLHVVGLLEPPEKGFLGMGHHKPTSTNLWERAKSKLQSDNSDTFKEGTVSWETFSKLRTPLPTPNTHKMPWEMCFVKQLLILNIW